MPEARAQASLATLFGRAAPAAEGTVGVDISYDIIRQFSKQLYTNPRKAVEELVCNSYDAGATECFVRIPQVRGDPLLVLDNGTGMNLEGLQDLWHVAVSPKAQGSGDRVANNRLQIGKFGVGKLAAFALGGRLTHVTSREGVTRLVSVSQGQLQDTEGGAVPLFEVRKLTDLDARPILSPFLRGLPFPWEKGWTSWTLAIVEEIEDSNLARSLKVGYLRKMISHALPVSANFQTFLDGELVPKRNIDPAHIVVKFDVADVDFRRRLSDALRYYWESRLSTEESTPVPRELYEVGLTDMADPEDVDRTIPAIDVPKLGKVSGTAIMADETLTTDRLAERGYSENGFAIYVHGKQVNPEDELFGVTQRTHQYWRRFLAVVEIPGLDRALLVQRNSVSESFDETLIARELLRELFNEARAKTEAIEEAGEYVPKRFGARLRTLAPILGPSALRGLARGGMPEGGLEAVNVEYRSLGEGGPPAAYDETTNTIAINEQHPTIVALDDLGPNAKQLRTVLGEVLAGTVLSQGYLRARSVPPDLLSDAFQLTYDALLGASGYLKDPVESHIQEIEEASFEGGSRFENAVVRAFRDLRLSATRYGAADEPDGIVEIPRAGKPNLKVSVEAKGSRGVITHAELSSATVDRHRAEFGCTNAVAIAREFQAQGIGEAPSALEREARAGQVPLLTTDAIALILRKNSIRPFTHDKLETILTTWVRPSEELAFIQGVWETLPDPGLMRDILEVAYEAQDADSHNFPDPGMVLANERIRARGLTRDQLIHVIEAIAVTTEMLVIRNTATHEFELLAHPDTILASMQRPTAPP